LTVLLISRGYCRCGRLMLVFQQRNRELAQRVSILFGEELDVRVSDRQNFPCSACGEPVNARMTEVLEKDESTLSKWLHDLEQELDDLGADPGELT
jgi:hypothetical protein